MVSDVILIDPPLISCTIIYGTLNSIVWFSVDKISMFLILKTHYFQRIWIIRIKTKHMTLLIR